MAYTQRIISLYEQYKHGILGKEEFQRLFVREMSRQPSREDLEALEAESNARAMRFQMRNAV